MALTDAQLVTFGDDIRANTDPDVVAAIASGADNVIAAHYNELSDQDVWKTAVTKEEYCGDAGLDWTEVDNLSVGKARIWEWVTSFLTASFNAADPNVRAGLGQAFTQAASPNTRANLLALGVRKATRAEALFAIDTPVADTMTFEGLVSNNDVANALRP